MKVSIKSSILGVIIFITHLAYYTLLGYLRGFNYSYNGFLGSMVYGFIFTFWIYWLLSYIYIYITKNNYIRITKYVKALAISFTGYLISRVPDMIDSRFIEKFTWREFLIFLLFVPLLVEIDRFLKRVISKSA